mmetsp:Transcript_19804/g.57466  ORF Transcript_19804/g.57466 Transcript_19804/m.57466 type:complete len:218 (+) Transcript_19804:633-1286(+)
MVQDAILVEHQRGVRRPPVGPRRLVLVLAAELPRRRPPRPPQRRPPGIRHGEQVDVPRRWGETGRSRLAVHENSGHRREAQERGGGNGHILLQERRRRGGLDHTGEDSEFRLGVDVAAVERTSVDLSGHFAESREHRPDEETKKGGHHGPQLRIPRGEEGRQHRSRFHSVRRGRQDGEDTGGDDQRALVPPRTARVVAGTVSVEIQARVYSSPRRRH